jgi:hypothetical protein
MLVTLLAWMYISIICWIYGYKFSQFLGKPADRLNDLHFSIVCFIGLAVLAVVGSAASLFIGLNKVYIHAALLMFALIFLIKIPTASFKRIKSYVTRLTLPTCLLLSISCIVILTMSVWHIKHPDTIDYHSTIIESIKNSKVEKGIALQDLRYGLQSNWFVGSALFSLDFFAFDNLTYINSAILVWVICFVLYHVHVNSFSRTGGNYYRALLWILFLTLAFWDYTQVRLSATSASPDYPTAVYILLIGYYFINYQLGKEDVLLLMFLIAFTFTLKLSSFALILILVFLAYLLLKKHASALPKAFFIFLVTCTPFLLRNYYSSGHLWYPSAFPMIGKPRWQVPLNEIQFLHDYIKAYARIASSEDPAVVQQAANAPLKNWIPAWWQLRSIAQKTMLLLTSIFIILSLGLFRSVFFTYTVKQKVLFAAVVLGLFSWFLLAPDPRFGIAYFILLAYLVLHKAGKNPLTEVIGKKSILISIGLLSLGLTLYLLYRVIYYFDTVNLLYPYSI